MAREIARKNGASFCEREIAGVFCGSELARENVARKYADIVNYGIKFLRLFLRAAVA